MCQDTLHTIGYEGSSIDDFLATLEVVGVNLLIDVRDVPLSRKKGFSKTALAEHLSSARIDYLHLKGLGDPKPGRIAARAGRFDEFRLIFGAHLCSKAAQDDLHFAVDASRGRMACLLCFERDHSRCHRCMVANEMVRLGGFKLQHLGVQHASKNSLIREGSRLTHGALTLIG